MERRRHISHIAEFVVVLHSQMSTNPLDFQRVIKFKMHIHRQ
jgi:hypothetical protein